ncbi:MAG: hypothetical protein WAW96_16610 [Alphaproteobacteria bacterium]
MLGGISLVSLLWRGFHFGLSIPLRDFLAYYVQLKALAFGWLEPYLNGALALLPLHLPKLHSVWRDFFILFGIVVWPMCILVMREGSWTAAVLGLLSWICASVFMGLRLHPGVDSWLLVETCLAVLALAALNIGYGWILELLAKRRGIEDRTGQKIRRLGLRVLEVFSAGLVFLGLNAVLRALGL